MTIESQKVVGIVIAGLGGAAVGLEREWSGHASGPEAHFAGIRTFTLLGGLVAVEFHARLRGRHGYWQKFIEEDENGVR